MNDKTIKSSRQVPTVRSFMTMPAAPDDEDLTIPILTANPLMNAVKNSNISDIENEISSVSIPNIEHSKNREVEEFEVGKTYTLSLHMFMPDPFNAREFYNMEEIDETGQSLIENGQFTAVSAYFKEGKMWVFDGVKRLKSAQSVSLKELRVEVAKAPSNAFDIYMMSWRMNKERSTQTSIDDAVKWDQLLKSDPELGFHGLVDRLGKSKSYVSQVLSINKIPRQILNYMKDKPGTTEQLIAYKISQIFSDLKEGEEESAAKERVTIVKEIIDEISAKRLSRKEVDRLIARRFENPRARTKSNSKSFKCFDQEGVFKVFPSKGKVEFSVSGLTESQISEIENLLLGVGKNVNGQEQQKTAG